MNYFEQIEAMHQQVREYVEKMEPNYKVVSIDSSASSEYKQTLASQGEIHPKYQEYILAEIQLRFKVHAFYKAGNRHLSCDVWVLPNGMLHMRDRLVSI
jgi:hypothetical protein